MSDSHFKKGAKVEISSVDDGFRGAWFHGTVIKPPSKRARKVTVEYETLVADEKESAPLRETIDLVQIRPTAPRERNRVFNLSEEVDAFYNDGWWEGVVTEALEGSRYSVYFRATGEQIEFAASDLRLHREWDNGKWIPPLEEEASLTSETNPTKETEEGIFSKGSLVEVSSDEDGFLGAWFAATILYAVEKDKFLVEYKDLRTEDDKDFLKEHADTLHIRPCPPETSRVDEFKQFEEVDAWYNDGWWVGVISKILDKSKYVVYFKGSNEEIEFEHSDLRLHQDWIDGKWVTASKALNLSD
ncbi:hypothetical protein Nepgr_012255 [Nepenthes gracilis]|uniref:Agenet domain-containing protein n=1 Tax=Nepenthes gracilis TaxID=150966 RepID=A0AAD3SGY7_NEPGR|nr:hypothetical protein Nepgr_012255 [Nepenthes gracilis]